MEREDFFTSNLPFVIIALGNALSGKQIVSSGVAGIYTVFMDSILIQSNIKRQLIPFAFYTILLKILESFLFW